jgi:FlaA1/EpsC-like NDP-sugar epimerase
MLLNQRTWTIVVLQGVLVLSSLLMAWTLRFEFSCPDPALLLAVAPVLLAFRLAAMARFGLFHGYWRYTGVRDAEDILKSVGLGTVGFLFSIRIVLGITRFPLSIYVLEALLSALLLGGVRLLCRSLMQRARRIHPRRRRDDPAGRVLVVGAGAAAEMLIRELPQHGYTPVGCVDDDPAKRRVKVHGVPVLGRIERAPEIASSYQIDELMVAMPSVTGARMRRIVEICQNSNRKFKIIPSLRNLLQGKVTVGQLREVQLEDLLGREPVQLDLATVRQDIEGKVVMVTGAAGSIGSELCRQILGYGPAKLICLDQAETPLFYLELALAKIPSEARTKYCVADINDVRSMRRLFLQYGVEIIFHAAAYKHVPMMEANLHEALKNNVFALLSLLDVAQESGCQGFLLISSDKAVHPTSFMGCTKRLGELMIAARTSSTMRCVSVRFGNVLGSQGSVVPIFQEQIRTTQRITITHPQITRYFMTIPEAVSLVLQAYTVGKHADVLVLDMGEPVRILELAKTLIRLSGKSEEEIEITFTGLRAGEKLYEELFYSSEEQLPTPNRNVKRAHSKRMSWPILREHLAVLAALGANGSDASIREKMKEIIPEYQYEPEKHVPREPGIEPLAVPLLSPLRDGIPDLVATAATVKRWPTPKPLAPTS